MNNRPSLVHWFVAVAAFALSAGACVHAAGAAPAKSAAKSAAPARPAGEVVPYEALENQVGAEIAVETTHNTVRRGRLLKYTNPTLKLELGPEHGSIELSVPRETVRTIRLLSPAAPAAGEAQNQGSSSAQKN